jgi:hypothetical protein
VADWCQPIGGVSALRSAERALLHRCAEMLLFRPRRRTCEDEVRIVNTISKVLGQVGLIDKRRRRETAKVTLAEYLSGRRTAQDAQTAAPATQVATESDYRTSGDSYTATTVSEGEPA